MREDIICHEPAPAYTDEEKSDKQENTVDNLIDASSEVQFVKIPVMMVSRQSIKSSLRMPLPMDVEEGRGSLEEQEGRTPEL